MTRILIYRLHGALTDCVGIANDITVTVPGTIFLCESGMNFLEPGSILPATMSLFLVACPSFNDPSDPEVYNTYADTQGLRVDIFDGRIT